MALTENDYIADETEFQSLIGIEVSAGSTFLTPTQADSILAVVQGTIHDFLLKNDLVDTVPVANTVTGYYTIKQVLIEILQGWIARRQGNKINNMMEMANAPQPTSGYLTPDQQTRLYVALAEETEQDSVDCIPMYRNQFHEYY